MMRPFAGRCTGTMPRDERIFNYRYIHSVAQQSIIKAPINLYLILYRTIDLDCHVRDG